MPSRYYIVENQILDSAEKTGIPSFLLEPSLRLNDKIWFCNGNIPFFNEHLSQLNEEINFLNLPSPEILKNPDELKRLILRMVNKNKAFHSGLIFLSFFFLKQKVNSIATIQVHDSDIFEFKEGVLATLSENKKLSTNELNRYRFYNSSFWDAASYMALKPKAGSFIIINEKDEIVECPEANIFFIKGDTLYTPSTETGCFIDPVRSRILESASKLNLKIAETTKLNYTAILAMEEAFSAGESKAMQRITGIGTKRYTHLKTAKIHELLNIIILPG